MTKLLMIKYQVVIINYEYQSLKVSENLVILIDRNN